MSRAGLTSTLSADLRSHHSATVIPRLKKAVVEAAETLIHTSNLYYIPPQAELADALTKVTPL